MAQPSGEMSGKICMVTGATLGIGKVTAEVLAAKGATVIVADRAKLFATRLGDEEDSGEEAAPKQSKLGITVRALTPEMADRLNVPSGKGVVVQEVKAGSFADDTGLTRGDIILELNKQPINSEDDFDRVQAGLRSGQDVVFLVRQRGSGRDGGTIFLAGTLP